ncbi:MAG: hypothetical protein JW720_10075 [Sedimentisphaerales bacterium]|nr:hypothetical protein [Sedimentisphaerales bacterium]
MLDQTKTILVLARDVAKVRGPSEPVHRYVQMNAEELSSSINIFVGELGKVLENTPKKAGKFLLTEISCSAELTVEGKVVLCGIGGQVGLSGGLSFVFKREEG